MARFRPPCPLVAFSPEEATVREMALSWGVTPMRVEVYGSTDDIVWHAVEQAVHHGMVTTGDTVVVIAGAPVPTTAAATQSSSDVLRVVRVR